MENGIDGGVGGVNQKISCDDVISKLKDDGDFDRLRLKIVRKLRENEELRNSIVAIVKQSAALNRPGAENMKPRQLSDAIHQEVGGKVNEQISDGLWEIIRSRDNMKNEITETVKTVYDKLSKPKRDDNAESSHGAKRIRKENDPHKSNINEIDNVSDNELKEPPGFSQADSHQIDIILDQTKNDTQEILKNDTLDPISPAGYYSVVDQKQPCDGSDEDLDAPPGFG